MCPAAWSTPENLLLDERFDPISRCPLRQGQAMELTATLRVGVGLLVEEECGRADVLHEYDWAGAVKIHEVPAAGGERGRCLDQADDHTVAFGHTDQVAELGREVDEWAELVAERGNA